MQAAPPPQAEAKAKALAVAKAAREALKRPREEVAAPRRSKRLAERAPSGR